MAGAISHATGQTDRTSRNVTSDRTLELLMLFDEEHPVRSAAEIAELFDMPRSTTYRYLQTLRSYGLIEEQGEGKYRLGARVLQLARIARAGLGLSEVALDVMRRLSEQTGEVVLLTRRSGASVVCVERVDASSHRLRLAYERGHVLPVHAGASAKVILAFADPADVDAVLKTARLMRFTPRTVVDPKRLRQQFAEIRARGYAFTDGEVDEGVRGIAAPIFDADRHVTAGLSVAGPASRLGDRRIAGVARAVRASADEITARLTGLAG